MLIIKEYGVKIPVKGYTTRYVLAESEEDAINKVLDDDCELISEPEDEIDFDYRFKSDISVWKCED